MSSSGISVFDSSVIVFFNEVFDLATSEVCTIASALGVGFKTGALAFSNGNGLFPLLDLLDLDTTVTDVSSLLSPTFSSLKIASGARCIFSFGEDFLVAEAGFLGGRGGEEYEADFFADKGKFLGLLFFAEGS